MPCMSKYNLFLFSDWEGRGGLTLWEGLRHIICSGRTGNENTGLVKSELQCFMKIGHRRLRSLQGRARREPGPPAESGATSEGAAGDLPGGFWGNSGFFKQF